MTLFVPWLAGESSTYCSFAAYSFLLLFSPTLTITYYILPLLISNYLPTLSLSSYLLTLLTISLLQFPLVLSCSLSTFQYTVHYPFTCLVSLLLSFSLPLTFLFSILTHLLSLYHTQSLPLTPNRHPFPYIKFRYHHHHIILNFMFSCLRMDVSKAVKRSGTYTPVTVQVIQ